MAHLSFVVLGPLDVLLDGQSITGQAYDKVWALLVYLALEADRLHRRDALIGLFWPDKPEQAARANFRQALSQLRQALGDDMAQPPFLLIARETIQFNRACDYTLDTAQFMAMLDACAHHPHRHPEICTTCARRRQEAAALYRGSFLEGFFLDDASGFEEWALLKREAMHDRAMGALTDLANYYERRGAYEDARRYAQRQLELDLWNEAAHRQVMRTFALTDQRNAALRQYELCRRVLADELGVEPEAKTTLLYEHIRDGASSAFPLHELKTYTSSHATQHRHSFPTQTTPLIGRESEIAELGALLEDPACRLVTVVGLGGVGKTRLALAAASEQAGIFADGAAFVPLQELSSSAFVAPAILAALRVPLQGRREPREQLIDVLREKELLLLLDNLEQLLGPEQVEGGGVADMLADMLHNAAGLTLLVTSRARLGLPGEWLYDLVGLSYPGDEANDGVEHYTAVRLFVQRARQVQRQFALDGEARAVARICRLVEGMPLAIELAAAALRARSCTAIAAAIESNLSTLSIELRAVPERHRSIRATFAHSWRLLSDQERQVVARLSVFRGGFEADAAFQVAQATPQILTELLDKSLLRWDGAARYDMHELVRQYAGEKLEQAGEDIDTSKHHAAYFLDLTQTAEPKLRGPEQRMWLVRLEAEQDNLRAVLQWAIDSLEVETGLRLAGALGWFWYVHDHFTEGRGWLFQLLTPAASRSITAVVRTKALNVAGSLALQQGDYISAAKLLDTSLALAREVGDTLGIAWSLHMHALQAYYQGDSLQAIVLSEQSLRLYREIRDSWGIAASLLNLGNAMRSQGRYEQATEYYDECLMIWQEMGDKRGIAFALSERGHMAWYYQADYNLASDLFRKGLLLFRELEDPNGIAWGLRNLGCVAHYEGDYGQATALLEESLALSSRLGNKRTHALALIALGNIVLEQGEYRRTVALAQASLRLCQELDSKKQIAANLDILAAVAGVQGQPERAARLFGAATALREAIGTPVPPGERPAYERNVASVRGQLGAPTFAAAWAEGRALTLEQAIAYALNESTEGNLQ